MQKLFWICLSSIIAGLLIRIPFGGGGILLSDILLPLFALGYLAPFIFIKKNLPKVSFLAPGLFFLTIAFFSYLLGSWELLLKEKILSFSYLIRFFSILTFGVATTDFIQNSKKDLIPSFFKNLWIIAGIIIAFGFLQFYFLPDIGGFSTLGGFDPHIGRFLGTWMDPNFIAGFLSFLLPVLFGKFYQSTNSKEKTILGILIILFLYALFLTFSRSGYLALISGLCFFFLLRDPKIILLGILLSSFGLIVNERAQKRTLELLGTTKSILLRDTDEIDATANLRIESWTKSFELWQKYPLLGIGYNTYRFRASEEGIVDESFFSAGGSDSTFLTILVTTGIFGFLSFSYFYFKLWFINLRRFFHTKNELFLGFVAGISALFFHSFFVNSLLFPHIFLVILFVAGILESKKIQKI